MKIDLEAPEFARLIFEAKSKMQRADNCHGPNERCANCDHHEKCGNRLESLIPWGDVPPEHQKSLTDLAQAILVELKAR
jgi:hypothetical protein